MLSRLISSNSEIAEELARRKFEREVDRSMQSDSLDCLPARQFLSTDRAFIEYNRYTINLNRIWGKSANYYLLPQEEFSKWWQSGSAQLKFFAQILWECHDFKLAYSALKKMIALSDWSKLEIDLKAYAAYEGARSYRLEQSFYRGVECFSLRDDALSEMKESLYWATNTEPIIAQAALRSWGRGYRGNLRFYQEMDRKLERKKARREQKRDG